MKYWKKSSLESKFFLLSVSITNVPHSLLNYVPYIHRAHTHTHTTRENLFGNRVELYSSPLQWIPKKWKLIQQHAPNIPRFWWTLNLDWNKVGLIIIMCFIHFHLVSSSFTKQSRVFYTALLVCLVYLSISEYLSLCVSMVRTTYILLAVLLLSAINVKYISSTNASQQTQTQSFIHSHICRFRMWLRFLCPFFSFLCVCVFLIRLTI